MEPVSVSLIIPSYRNPKYLDLCLKSATENKDNQFSEIIVVLDGFVDESRAVIEKYPDVLCLELLENKGMQYALNSGVAQASNKFVCIINDDNVLPIKWDSRILESIIYSQHNYKRNIVLTIEQIEPTGPGMFNFPVKDFGHDVDTFKYHEFLSYESSLSKESNFVTQSGHIFPFVMEKMHYMAVGGFDTFYNSPNVCDWDFFLKLELLDFMFPRTHSVALYHFGSVATKKNKDTPIFIIKEQAAHDEFEWKWGIKPYNEYKTNSKIPKNRLFRGFTA